VRAEEVVHLRGGERAVCGQAVTWLTLGHRFAAVDGSGGLGREVLLEQVTCAECVRLATLARQIRESSDACTRAFLGSGRDEDES
jgi:hypothetical protein